MPDDIRIHVGFKDHIKTKKLLKMLGAEGLKSLVFLWLSARETRPKGNLEGLSDEDIELMGDWSGLPNLFVPALVIIGWLDKAEDGKLSLHDWETWQRFAFFSEERSLQATNAIRKRWEKKSNSKRIRKEYEPNTNPNTPSPLPLPSPVPSPSPSPSPQIAPVGRATFTPPTAEEVKAYAIQIGFPSLDPEYFVAFYGARNWMSGKTKLTDWKQCVVTWKTREKVDKPGNGGTVPPNNSDPVSELTDAEYRLYYDNVTPRQPKAKEVSP